MARDDIDAVDYRCLNVEVRELARVLSGVRTAVVQVDLLESLVTDDRDLRAGTRGLHRDVVAEADRQRRAVNVRTLRELSLRLSVVRSEVEHLPLPDVDRVPAGGISKTFRRGRRAMKSAYATPTITKFHIWRKQVKYLRHQMEILEAGGGQSLSALVSDLEQIGEGLGMDHDLADLERAARGTASDVLSPTDRRHLAEAISKRRDELEHGMKPIAARVYGANPASFAEQVTRRPG
jgi:CHAD domain-containing protein